MSEVNTIELPKPDAIIVEKSGHQLVIDFRKKKSGASAGTYVPFLPKENVTLDFLRNVLGDEFLISCGVTRYNSALGDWSEDVVEKKGLFSIEEFVKRVLSGKLVRLKIAEINEQLDEILQKMEAITLQVDAAGGTASPDGKRIMEANMSSIYALSQEMGRLNNLKLAQKRKKKDSDEDDE